MRAVIQRVNSASVTVNGRVTGAIDRGLLILLGVGREDGPVQCRWLANKVAGLRIFPDEEGKMNRSLLEEGLGALVVSQFTLYGDVRKGRRPSFVKAAAPEVAESLYERFCDELAAVGIVPVERGVFQAMMDVALVNAGPVTLVVDTP
ncbi:MAG: D-tyrosyl-tRNA(Tyr) deacylase [Deltaproteobacteria bacterium]|nr:D-tyrosyl-tRNA(Tyr) deacylase [Deltaproteobacteria bacterium]MBW2255735.1 D-tyrosyl-tRNA(Tyr) deacylase [Deltaproteobacteria bacterium]